MKRESQNNVEGTPISKGSILEGREIFKKCRRLGYGLST